ncbi:unnamed protein product [Blepharisma stoltei]|uniref:Uncharacterized protein n=1 Tax=Blepharisma stoltei TaxID=1481888 RepID=A0AAU9JVW0_9CILI|nr:unnamed protein product [Blepharisma stoltei]
MELARIARKEQIYQSKIFVRGMISALSTQRAFPDVLWIETSLRKNTLHFSMQGNKTNDRMRAHREQTLNGNHYYKSRKRSLRSWL